ncbi:MAG: helix-turn-helix transcriptional regulator [Candidatus Aminicenantes bacterium]
MKDLSLANQSIMLAIWRLGDNAYGVTIRKQVAAVTGRTYAYGTLYNILNQLAIKGYIQKSVGSPTPKRGGRRKIFYTLTPAGNQALKTARLMQEAIWKEIPEKVFEEA